MTFDDRKRGFDGRDSDASAGTHPLTDPPLPPGMQKIIDNLPLALMRPIKAIDMKQERLRISDACVDALFGGGLMPEEQNYTAVKWYGEETYANQLQFHSKLLIQTGGLVDVLIV